MISLPYKLPGSSRRYIRSQNRLLASRDLFGTRWRKSNDLTLFCNYLIYWKTLIVLIDFDYCMSQNYVCQIARMISDKWPPHSSSNGPVLRQTNYKRHLIEHNVLASTIYYLAKSLLRHLYLAPFQSYNVFFNWKLALLKLKFCKHPATFRGLQIDTASTHTSFSWTNIEVLNPTRVRHISFDLIGYTELCVQMLFILIYFHK